jgi:transposase
MLSWEDDVEAHALRRRGWSISAIARHLGHDRKTVRARQARARSSHYWRRWLQHHEILL